MYDIHCHLLPGVDDGAFSVDESIDMLDEAAAGGTVGIVATPHANLTGLYENHWCDGFERAIDGLRARLAKRNITLSLYPGQEIFLDGGGAFLSLLKAGELITVNRTKYPLVELDFGESEAAAVERLGALVSEGYTPVLAHPERYGFISDHDGMAAAERIRALGVLLQLNAGSLEGHFGDDAAYAAHRLLRRHFGDVIASDCHSPYRRTPALGQTHETVSELYGLDYANLLLRVNPHDIICGNATQSFDI